MNIACWGPVRRGGGVTSNIIAISEICSSSFGLKVGLRSNHICSNMVESYISTTREFGRVGEGTEVFSSPGNPDYLKYMLKYSEIFERKLFRGKQSVSRRQSFTLYRPPEPGESPFIRDNKEDIFFLDTSGGNNISVFEALEEADLRLIFLPGEIEAAIGCVNTYSNILERSMILINKGANCPSFPLSRFQSMFAIPNGQIAVIPRCDALMGACYRGEVDLMTRRIAESSEHADYLRKIRSISKKLIALRH
ncbi:MAG: hypothetical protein MJ124_04685 [Lachnospiraceae bacterium]|nr:hypothetical protein [Lachnospiraceae bacterium]